MIPQRLTVKNFMCYRDDVPTLDLGSIHVACLCGDNGHGKTALLDSITWVLWGQARTKTQEELVHQGQRDMSVELEFFSRDQLYRVSRRFQRSARSRQGHTILELQVESGDDFRAITGNTIRDTEQRIKELVNLDYDTFVNTAFLLQGRADMFTSSTPAKRKECLAEVLDLSYYEQLEEQAKLKSRDLLGKVRDIDSLIEIRKQEIDRRPEFVEQLANLDTSLLELAPDILTRREAVDESRRTVETLHERANELDATRTRLTETRTEVSHLERQASGQSTRLSDYESVMERKSEITASYESLIALRVDVERMNLALSEKNVLDGQKAELEREVAVQKQRHVSDIEQLKQKLANDLEPAAAKLPEIERRFQSVNATETHLNELDAKVATRREGVKDLEAQLEHHNQSAERFNTLEIAKTDLLGKVAIEKERLSNQAEQVGSRIKNELKPKAERLPQVEAAIAQMANEEVQIATLEASLRENRGRAEEFDGRIRILNDTNGRLYTEMEDTRQKFDLLESGQVDCPLCRQPLDETGIENLRAEYRQQGQEKKRQYTENRTELTELTQVHEQLVQLVNQLETSLETRRAQFQMQKTELTRDQQDSRSALAELETLSTQLNGMLAILGIDNFALDERARIVELEQEIESLGYNPDSRRQLGDLVSQVRSEITQLDSELGAGRTDTASKVAILTRERQQATEAQAQIAPALAEIDQLQSLLDIEDFAQNERSELYTLNGRIDDLGYDADAHEQARNQAASLEQYDNLNRKLSEATEHMPTVQEELQTTQQMLSRRAQEIAESEAKVTTLEEDIKALPEIESRYRTQAAELAALEKRRDDIQVRHGVVQQQIDRCDALQSEISDQEGKRAKFIDEQDIYDDLVGAFGKNGIQALIIESAIPQLEDDANELLGRLTENRMFLRLQVTEGRRDRRTHLPSEELDIRISDEIGTRSYETFSGGEAFRINFALRIALSKLLARRSGASLPILFIDEGFGSQDRDGQERLTEAIQSIQDDFQKIIVITHIEQIKEAFPVRIEVLKTESGSQFSIV